MKWDLKKYWNFKWNKDMSIQKKALRILSGFLLLMLLFTFLSRAALGATIAKVTVQKPESKVIEQTVEASGKVEENREQAIRIARNITVSTIYVSEGQQVKAGDILVQLDRKDLEEQILMVKQEIEKLELNNKDIKSQKSVTKQKKAAKKAQASEDIELAEQKGDKAIAQAAQALETAQHRLDEFYANQHNGSIQESDAVLDVLNTVVNNAQSKLDAANLALTELENAAQQDAELERARQAVRDAEYEL